MSRKARPGSAWDRQAGRAPRPIRPCRAPRTDTSKTNSDWKELERKHALLREPHVAPLNAYVERSLRSSLWSKTYVASGLIEMAGQGKENTLVGRELRSIYKTLRPGGFAVNVMPIDDWHKQRAYDPSDPKPPSLQMDAAAVRQPSYRCRIRG